MKVSTRQILIGTALVVVPGTSILLGGYLIYKGVKKVRAHRPKTLRETIDHLIKKEDPSGQDPGV